MKTKTIHKTIKAKLDEWIATLPTGLRKQVKDSVILTGGSIASMLLCEPVNDYDLYFADYDSLLAVIQHYIKELPGVKIWEIEDEYEHEPIEDRSRVRICIPSAGARQYTVKDDRKYGVIYVTENALTLSDDIQLVTRFIGDAKEIHSNYDFVHAMNYWTYKEGLVLKKDALASLLTKELRYSGSKYPLCSIIRTRKFISRGFTCNAGQYLKMALQLNQFDLMDISVLRDQLVGVDSAYFEAFIKCVDKKSENTEITCDYLVNLVDYIFDRELEKETTEDSENEVPL